MKRGGTHKHLVMSIDREKKTFDKIQKSFMIKALRKLEIEEHFLVILKSTYEKSNTL